MDAGIMDEDGQVYVMARDDDVINVAGHRLSTAALEEALLEHPCISEAVVVGVPDTLKGDVPLGLYVTTKGRPHLLTFWWQSDRMRLVFAFIGQLTPKQKKRSIRKLFKWYGSWSVPLPPFG
jgi:acyl-CoA synthetase (AMP-forming)/AMP-acid ligase II